MRPEAAITARAAMDDTDILLIRSHHGFGLELIVLHFMRLTASHYALMKKKFIFNRNIIHTR